MLFNKALWATCMLAATCSATHWKKVLNDLDLSKYVQKNAEGRFEARATYGGDNNTVVQVEPKAYAVDEMKPMWWKDLGSKRAQIKYGPFKVQPMNKENGMIDYLQIGTPMPCKDCHLTYIHAGLEYPNGTRANADTSLWLHHVVFIDIAQPDTVCGSDYYAKGLRWFASGNERTPMDITISGKLPVGYHVSDTSFNVMLVELMNQEMHEQEAVLTMTYEWVPGKPKGWYDARPMWLDIAGCHIESEMPAKTNTTFNYEMSPEYISKYEGPVIGMGGHFHDGGTNLHIIRNDKMECNCEGTYGGNPAYLSPPGAMMDGPGHCMAMDGPEMSMSMESKKPHMTSMKKSTMHHMSSMKMSMHTTTKHAKPTMSMKMSTEKSKAKATKTSGMHMPSMTRSSSMPSSTGLTWCGGTPMEDREHISKISTCYAPGGMIKKGDKMSLKVWYNFNKHAPMLNWDGSIADIMGIGILFFAEHMTMEEMDHFMGVHHSEDEKRALMWTS